VNKRLIALPVVVAALAAGAWWWKDGRGEAGSDLVLHGNMDIRHVELAFNASGRIAEVLAREGDRVARDQALARLDTTRLKLQLAQAEALATSQKSQVAKLRAGSRPEEIRQAAAQRDAARVAVEDASQVYRRQLDLVERKFVPQQQADSAKNALDAARERLKAAEETLRLAELGPRKEDVAAAEAALAAQEAAVAALRHDIAEGELRASADGVVEKRILEPGDMATPQKTVFTIALADSAWARVYLPETALGRVPMGAKATITTDSHPDRKQPAWVGYVSPTAEFTPKTVETTELRTSLVYQARVFACEGAAGLRQGMPVTVTIALDQPAPAAKPCPGAK
jgi:HlyD family secretion protein